MRIAIIGRTEILYDTTVQLLNLGYEIPLIITAKEAPEYKVTRDDFKQLALKFGIDFIASAKIHSVEMINHIEKNLPLDIGVSMNYPGIISQRIIDYFRIGVINAHGGDLPRYRGNAPQAWAIINGEDKIVMCIHKMIGDKLDSGNIIEKEHFPINIDNKIGDYHLWAEKTIPELFISSVKKLEKDPKYFLQIQSKNPGDSLRCYPRLPQDGKIDWSRSNIQIMRLINASSEPYAGAFCEFEGKKCTIWKAELFEDNEVYLAVPGQVAAILESGEVITIAGKGKIKIKEIEIENHRGKPSLYIKSIRQRLR